MYPNISRYPSRTIAESLLECHITEDLFGEDALFSCLEDKERNAVEAKVFWMLEMMEACGFFADIVTPKAA
jgi:hypothetical protein